MRGKLDMVIGSLLGIIWAKLQFSLKIGKSYIHLKTFFKLLPKNLSVAFSCCISHNWTDIAPKWYVDPNLSEVTIRGSKLLRENLGTAAMILWKNITPRTINWYFHEKSQTEFLGVGGKKVLLQSKLECWYLNYKLEVVYLISVECNPQAFIDNIGKVMETLPCLVVNIFLLFYKNQDKHI